MAWNHPTKYRHYIQKYTYKNTSYPVVDIEEQFKCRYVSLEGVKPTDVKNIYTEDFAEKSGLNVWIPPQKDLTFKSSEISLSLRWRSDECNDVLKSSDDFYNYVVGHALEYHDTFRPNKYLQLILSSAPEIVYENLKNKIKYLIMKYKFTNLGGKIYSSTLIK